MGLPKIVEIPSGVNEHVTAVSHSSNHCVTALGTAEGVVKVIRNRASAADGSITFNVPSHVTVLSWAHPEQGRVLAVGTSKGHLQIWTQQSDAESASKMSGSVRSQFQHNNHALRSIAFAPKQLGLVVACSGDDGVVRIYEADRPMDPHSWLLQSTFQASTGECTCLCWQPYSQGVPPLLAVGSDRGAHLWMWNPPEMRWQRLTELVAEKVSSLHWAPAMGRDHERVAVACGSAVRVCSIRMEGGEVQVGEEGGVLEARSPVWRVEWNMTGTVLGCSTTASEVQLWQQALGGAWRKVSSITGGGRMGEEQVD